MALDTLQVALYVNGLAIAHNGKEVRACFSPFTLVRNCKFQDSATCSQLMSLKIFKIFFFVKNLCYFFGVSADDEGLAEKERQQWVADVARAVPSHALDTRSFPSLGLLLWANYSIL